MKKLLIAVLFVILAMNQEVFAQWTSGSGNTTTNDKVGIGTNNPLNILHLRNLNSSVYLRIEKQLGYEGGLAWTDPSGASLFYLYSDNADNDAFKIQASGLSGEDDANPRIMIPRTSKDIYLAKSGGNIGIGTSSPLHKLDVYQGEFRIWNGNGSSPLRIYSRGDGTHNGAPLDIWSEGSGGNQKLYHDISNWYGNFIWRFGYGQGLWTGMIVYPAVGGSGTARGAAALGLYNDEVQNIKLSAIGESFFNAGNVLIGKTSQASTVYKLDVAGKMRADEIVVNTSGAYPDFVFQDDYKLKPLTELEKEIKSLRHLPGIPSEKEATENGIPLGEMQTKLLQKIEELTLYVIELKKENDELKNDLKELCGKIKE